MNPSHYQPNRDNSPDQNHDPTRANMSKPGNRGIKRLVAATAFSFKGFRAAWQQEEAFRQEMLLALVLFPAAFWLGQTTVETLLLLLSCIMVIFAELSNTAIESIVDRIGAEHHPLSGQAKDLGSALVFVSNMTVLLVWGMIAWQRWCG
jgi:diacylglycerol kinase (ATP)